MVGSQPWVLISVSPAVPGSSQSARSCRTAWTPEPEAPGPAATQVTQPGPCRVSLHQPGSKSRWSWPSPGSELKAQGALPTHCQLSHPGPPSPGSRETDPHGLLMNTPSFPNSSRDDHRSVTHTPLTWGLSPGLNFLPEFSVWISFKCWTILDTLICKAYFIK